MPLSRSSEAASWRSLPLTGTLSASSVCGPTEPVSGRPWRVWKRFTASVSIMSYSSPSATSAGRSSVIARRARSFATSGPEAPGARFTLASVGQPPRTSIAA